MKKTGKKLLNKIWMLIGLGLIFTLILSGCPEEISRQGNVTITIGASNERTLRPDDITSTSAFDYIELMFNEDTENPVRLEKGATSYNDVFDFGEYNITAKGYITIGNKDFEAANGSTNITVTNSGGSGNITLNTGIFEGMKGVFSYNITIPGTINTATLAITPFDAFLGNSGSEEPINIVDARTDSMELDPGYYFLRINVINSESKTAAWSELVHIYSGRETRADHSFTADDFTVSGRVLGGTATIIGTNRIGQQLTANVGSITGADGIYSYQWRRGETNIGTNSATYSIAAADAGQIISCNITHIIATGTITATGSTVPYDIDIIMSGNTGTDALTAAPEFGIVEEDIILNYTVANTLANNRLVFSGVASPPAPVESAGTGTRTYTVTAADAVNGVITITGTFSHSDKSVDTIAFADTENETRTYGDAAFTKAIENSGSGTGTITYTSSTPSVATVNSTTGEVTILVPGTTTITATKAEDGTYSQTTASYTLTVNKAELTIIGIGAENKVYDRNTTATISGTAELQGRVNGDTEANVALTATGRTATFADRDVGNGKTVTFVGFALDGTYANDRYNLTQPPSVTANITARQLVFATDPIVTTTRAYDGTNATNGSTNAGVTGGTLAATGDNGIVSGDTVNIATRTGTYNSGQVASATTITVSVTIGGANADNYLAPISYTVAGTITKAAGRAVLTTAANIRADNITATGLRVGNNTAGDVTLDATPDNGQTVEYAVSTETNTPSTGWQSNRSFTGLTPNTAYYLFARSAETANFAAGEARRSSTTYSTLQETGGLDLGFTITNEITNETVTFTNTDNLTVAANNSLTVTVNGSYHSYTWLVDGEVMSEATGNSLTLQGINYTPGPHQILVIVRLSAGGIPYSQEIDFMVTN